MTRKASPCKTFRGARSCPGQPPEPTENRLPSFRPQCPTVAPETKSVYVPHSREPKVGGARREPLCLTFGRANHGIARLVSIKCKRGQWQPPGHTVGLGTESWSGRQAPQCAGLQAPRPRGFNRSPDRTPALRNWAGDHCPCLTDKTRLGPGPHSVLKPCRYCKLIGTL